MRRGEAERAGSAAERRQSLQLRALAPDEQLDREVEPDRHRPERRGDQPRVAIAGVDQRQHHPDRQPDGAVLAEQGQALRHALRGRRVAAGPHRVEEASVELLEHRAQNTVRAPMASQADLKRLTEYEEGFRHAGLPLFSEDRSPYEDVFNRAAPLLALVFLGEMLGAGNLDWSWWQNLLAVAGGLAILLVSFGLLNRARGRPFRTVPERLGKTELAGFVLLPALLPLIFGGPGRQRRRHRGRQPRPARADLRGRLARAGLDRPLGLPSPRQPAPLSADADREGGAAARDLRAALLPHPGALGNLLQPDPRHLRD